MSDQISFSGFLVILYGPMFSGKTSELIKRLSQHSDIFSSQIKFSKPPLYVCHVFDLERTESPSNSSTIKDTSEPSSPNCLSQLRRSESNGTPYSHATRFKGVPDNIDSVFAAKLSDVDIEGRHIIGVDEAQFFDDLELVNSWVDKGITVIAAGLHANYEGKKFGKILDMIPNADDSVFLPAVCYYCVMENKGVLRMDRLHNMKASHTVKISESKELIDPGAIKDYRPACRSHHKQHSKH